MNWQRVQKDAESAESDRDLENRLADVEGRLKEAEQERDGFKDVCWFTEVLVILFTAHPFSAPLYRR